jgi:hypothetical protein
MSYRPNGLKISFGIAHPNSFFNLLGINFLSIFHDLMTLISSSFNNNFNNNFNKNNNQ